MDTRLHTRLIVAAASLSLALIAASAAPPPAPDGAPPSPPPPVAKRSLTVRDALRLLVEEAQAVRSKKLPLPEKPDYAARFDGTPDAKDVFSALARRAHPDAFVDAYVRWQLTSFNPPLPAMDDKAFAAFMDAAPPLVANPRAADKMLLILRAADEAGPLSEPELDHVRNVVGDMEKRAQQAEAMNKPAIEFRDWVDARLGKTGPRPRQWLLERCIATVQAGWSARLVKGEIARQFSASVSDGTFTTQQRQMVGEQARSMVGLSRQFVDKASFMADSSVKIGFSTTAVDGDDVEKWIKRLAGEPVDEKVIPRG